MHPLKSYLFALLFSLISFVVYGQTEYNTLIWADEFDQEGVVDPNKWFLQTKLPTNGSWYNGEIQHYTDRRENAYVQNGVLKITARRENFTDQGHTKAFTSARLNSKFSFKEGRVVVRAKLPTGVGTWPAIWTLGRNINENGAYWQTQGYGTVGWPACGELDIMEHWGHNQDVVQSAIHTPSSHGNTVNKGGQTVNTASTGFNEYEMIWSPEKIVFSVNGREHYTYQPAWQDENTWPFDGEQYLLLNIAIQQSIEASFTDSSMEVDYVRVYGKSTTAVNETIALSNDQIFPNPFTDELTIHLDQAVNEKLKISLFDINGGLQHQTSMFSQDNKLYISELDSLSAGVYILNIEGGDKTWNGQVVKR